MAKVKLLLSRAGARVLSQRGGEGEQVCLQLTPKRLPWLTVTPAEPAAAFVQLARKATLASPVPGKQPHGNECHRGAQGAALLNVFPRAASAQPRPQSLTRESSFPVQSRITLCTKKLPRETEMKEHPGE